MRRTTAVLAALSLIGVLAACGGANPADRQQSGSPAAEGFPITVQNCGRELSFDEPPSRVVTGYLPPLETLIELGVEDSVIGRTPFDELGEGEGFLPGHEEIYQGIPEISEDISLPPKEEMLALGADLVVVVAYFEFDAESGRATIEELEANGTQVFITGEWCSPEEVMEFEIQDSIDDVRDLGEIFGVPDRGEELAADLETRLADVDDRVEGLEPLRVVYADPRDGAFNTKGRGLGNEVLERAGGTNVFADADDYAEVSVEEVAAADAQAYVVMQFLPVTAQERIAGIEAVAPNSEGVQEQRYVVVPAVALHPGIRNIDSVEIIAKTLHPEAFDD